MAKKSGSEHSTDLIKREIDRSRGRLSRDVSGLRYELDIPRKFRRSFREQTSLWVGAAVAVGAILVYLPRSRKTVHVEVDPGGKEKKKKILETGFLLGALRIAAPLLKPFVLNFVKNKMRGEPASFARGPRKW
jgi:hypothetical protein